MNCDLCKRNGKVYAWLLCLIQWTTWLMLSLSCIAILLVFFQDCCHLKFSLTAEGFSTLIGLFSRFSSLFEGTMLVLTIFVAILTYERSVAINEIKGLQDLRKMLSSKENMKIHELLERENEVENDTALRKKFKASECEIYNYLGTLELAELYIEKNIISIETFKSQFGYRVENVFKNAFLKEKLTEQRNYWEKLFKLYNLVNH